MKYTILLMMIVFANSVFADQGLIESYDVDQVFMIPVHLTNQTGNVTGANCNVLAINENGNTTFTSQMEDIGGGNYNVSYSNNEAGYYRCVATCTKAADVAFGSCDFKIEDSQMLTAIIFIFLVAALLLVFAVWKEDTDFGFMSGFLFCAIGMYIMVDGLPSFNNWVSNSLGIITVGVSLIIMWKTSIQNMNGAS